MNFEKVLEVPKRTKVAFAAILGLHVLGLGLLSMGAAAAASFSLILGLGSTAYLLGLRHAFDADHIAAIDNTVRRLSAEKKDSSLVGLFFSLGHSTVVLAAGLGIAAGFTFIAEMLNDDASWLKSTGSLIGGTVAGLFLTIIAIVNTVILVQLLSSRKTSDTTNSTPKGILTTLFAPLLKNVDKDWKMYPLGVLFGLGFDTATSIALLAIAGGGAVLAGQSWIAIALPIIFMSGMALGDTIDSILMSKAYNYSNDIKSRTKYFIVITTLSIFAALVVGVPILSENISNLLGVPFRLQGIENEYLGLMIVVGFMSVWAISYLASSLIKKMRKN